MDEQPIVLYGVRCIQLVYFGIVDKSIENVQELG